MGNSNRGLHDEADLQKNGLKIRTYAKTPSQDTLYGVNNPRQLD